MQIRSKENVRLKGEVFTPPRIVDDMLQLFPESVWSDPEYIFLEPTCGHGNFLVAIFKKRLEAGLPIQTILNTMYGMDISEENINDCHSRLTELIGHDDYHDLLKRNIFVVKDSLEQIKHYGKQTGELYEKINCSW